MDKNLLAASTAVALVFFPVQPLNALGSPGSFGPVAAYAAEVEGPVLLEGGQTKAKARADKIKRKPAVEKTGEKNSAGKAMQVEEKIEAPAQLESEPATGKIAAEEETVVEDRAKAAADSNEVERKPAADTGAKKKSVKKPKQVEEKIEEPASSSPQPATEKVTAEEEPVVEDRTKAAAESEAAPEPKVLAVEPIAVQIKKAEEQAPAVVPDDLSGADRENLKAAEKVRRAAAKQNWAELIGAAAAGAAIGAVIPVIGGRIIADEGDRFVVERSGVLTVRKDESALLRDRANTVEYERLASGRVRETITRPNGVRIVTLRDAGGYVLKRTRILPNGDEIVLFDWRNETNPRFVDYDKTLPPIRLVIPIDVYIVVSSRTDRRSLYDVFQAPPVEEIHSGYSLREVRENRRLRDIVRRVDLDTITFEPGSASVPASQVSLLGDIAGGMLDVINQDTRAVFLIEGHTDAVGAEIYNLMLSDRRAETVARILSEGFGVPPENLVTEGYGEQFLKLETQVSEPQNCRVTVRNISPLLISDAQ